jgi:hypothetical protein
VAVELPLIVRSPPGVDLAFPDRGLKRWGVPKLEGLRRLNVIVAIDQDRR